MAALHPNLQVFIDEMERLCEPQDIHIADGSKEEAKHLSEQLVRQGAFIKLNEDRRPNSYLARSHPKDVARVEGQTFICCDKEEDAGPTNHWKDPAAMKSKLMQLFQGCMRGRTMYVIPFCMGPYGSKLAKLGVQISDSPYVVVNMGIMTRMGRRAMEEINASGEFTRCCHTVGFPLESGQKDVAWPCNEEKWITHFPTSNEIWSYGSGYGGNALLGKKCLALRLASAMAKEEMWLAEHMLILGVTNPEGKKRYVAAAFPSACGKTNFAMMQPKLPGWKIECIGDDIAWIRVGNDGAMYAVNPEKGFFGVAPGTSMKSNPNAMLSIAKDSIFTNVAFTDEDDVWWEGMTAEPPSGKVIDWKGNLWNKDGKEPAAHPNARFTAPIENCPTLDPSYGAPEGVRIDAFIFGGRRAKNVPLVMEAKDWAHGVFIGAALASEKTAAAEGKRGEVRRDPFAMLPFCGYHMADYFQHWLDMENEVSIDNQPRFFQVNWFLKDRDGKFVWPGFSDNLRVLKWICDRLDGKVEAEEVPMGLLPQLSDLDLTGLQLSSDHVARLFAIDREDAEKSLEDIREYFTSFGKKMPRKLLDQIDRIQHELANWKEDKKKIV